MQYINKLSRKKPNAAVVTEERLQEAEDKRQAVAAIAQDRREETQRKGRQKPPKQPKRRDRLPRQQLI